MARYALSAAVCPKAVHRGAASCICGVDGLVVGDALGIVGDGGGACADLDIWRAWLLISRGLNRSSSTPMSLFRGLCAMSHSSARRIADRSRDTCVESRSSQGSLPDPRRQRTSCRRPAAKCEGAPYPLLAANRKKIVKLWSKSVRRPELAAIHTMFAPGWLR